MAFSTQRSGKPVSRRTGVNQRSMFSQPETSAQQAHAFMSQSNSGNANQFIAQHKQRQQRGSGAPRSFFGGNRVPGQTEVQQPNSRIVRQRGGSEQRGKQRRQMSMSELGSFIARQNQRTGKSGNGGFSYSVGAHNSDNGYNFDRSMSRVGAQMARNGALPPELQQMAIPFESSRKKTRGGAAGGNFAQPSFNQQQRRNGKKSLDNVPQVGFINSMKRAQIEQQQQQSAQRSEQQQVQAALNMGVPFKSRARTQERAAPAPQQTNSQKTRVVKPTAVRAPPKVSRETAHRFRPIGEDTLNSLHSGLMRGGSMTQEQFLSDKEEQEPEKGLFDEHVQTIAKKREEMLQSSVAVLDDEPTQFPVSQQKRRTVSPGDDGDNGDEQQPATTSFVEESDTNQANEQAQQE